jgi:hypothetical protein
LKKKGVFAPEKGAFARKNRSHAHFLTILTERKIFWGEYASSFDELTIF